MPASGAENADGVWAVVGTVLTFGGLAVGYFFNGFMRSYKAPEPRTEEKRVVLESADLNEPSTMRNVGAKLTEMHPAVLATNQGVAEALVILRQQEHRAAVREEAERMFEEMKDRRRAEEDRRRNDDGRR